MEVFLASLPFWRKSGYTSGYTFLGHFDIDLRETAGRDGQMFRFIWLAVKSGQSIRWRERLGDDRKVIGDFAYHLHAILGLRAR